MGGLQSKQGFSNRTPAMQTSTDTNPGLQWELHEENLRVVVWFELVR